LDREQQPASIPPLPSGWKPVEVRVVDKGGVDTGERRTMGHSLRPQSEWEAVKDDVSSLALKNIIDALRRKSETDDLTGLLGRDAFWDTLNEIVTRGPSLLIHIDVDGMKTFNDIGIESVEEINTEDQPWVVDYVEDEEVLDHSVGHAYGDAVLIVVAEFLQSINLRGLSDEKSQVGRVGGDEMWVAALINGFDPDKVDERRRQIVLHDEAGNVIAYHEAAVRDSIHGIRDRIITEFQTFLTNYNGSQLDKINVIRSLGIPITISVAAIVVPQAANAATIEKAKSILDAQVTAQKTQKQFNALSAEDQEFIAGVAEKADERGMKSRQFARLVAEALNHQALGRQILDGQVQE